MNLYPSENQSDPQHNLSELKREIDPLYSNYDDNTIRRNIFKFGAKILGTGLAIGLFIGLITLFQNYIIDKEPLNNLFPPVRVVINKACDNNSPCWYWYVVEIPRGISNNKPIYSLVNCHIKPTDGVKARVKKVFSATSPMELIELIQKTSDSQAGMFDIESVEETLTNRDFFLSIANFKINLPTRIAIGYELVGLGLLIVLLLWYILLFILPLFLKGVVNLITRGVFTDEEREEIMAYSVILPLCMALGWSGLGFCLKLLGVDFISSGEDSTPLWFLFVPLIAIVLLIWGGHRFLRIVKMGRRARKYIPY